MFQKINQTKHPPQMPTLVWDGECGFCKFWKTRWQLRTGGEILFETYQEVSEDYPDIPLKEFKKASRLIEPEGTIYSGPDSAYRSIRYSGNGFWHELYTNQNWFMKLSDVGYNHIAKNRSFYFTCTKLLFGKNPKSLKPFWVIYLVLILLLISYLLS